jgi:PAS domain S-box-containing protein
MAAEAATQAQSPTPGWRERLAVRIIACLADHSPSMSCIEELLRMVLDESKIEFGGIRLRDGDDYPIVVYHGHTLEFIKQERRLLGSDACAESRAIEDPKQALNCLCGAVLRGDRSVAPALFTPGGSFLAGRFPGQVTEIDQTCLAMFRGRCVTAGFQTLALIPVRHAGETIGLFHLSDTRPDQLRTDDVAFFEQLGSSIGVALERKHTEEQLAKTAASHLAAQQDVKESEERYRTLDKRYRLLVENTSDVLWILDLEDFRFRYVSPSVERLRGFSAVEVMSEDASAALTPSSLVLVREIVAAYNARPQRDETESLTEEIEQPCKDGRTVWTETTVRAMRDDDGRMVLYGVSRDITRRRKAEEEHRALQQQLFHAQKMESLGILAGGIAHDFNNILSVIEGWAEMGRMDLEGSGLGNLNNVRDSLDRVLQASRRAKGLIEQILAFSQRGKVEKQPLHLSTLIKETCRFVRAALPTTIHIESVLSTDGLCLGSATQIHQMLMNLFTNAAAAMPEGGRIDVALDEVSGDEALCARHPDLAKGRLVRMRIRDSGVGILSEDLGRVFEPFFSTRRDGQGSGLGLSVVHGIVSGHHGAIEVSSTVGVGTTFEIYLPLLTQTGEHVSTSATPQRGKERVLFVDDEEALVEIARRGLVRLGYHVQAFSNSMEALRVFRAQPTAFDVVVSDVTMPELPGDLLVKEVRRLRPQIPAILLTGMSDRLSAEQASALGIDAYLFKPVTLAALSERIRQAIDSRANQNQS